MLEAPFLQSSFQWLIVLKNKVWVLRMLFADGAFIVFLMLKSLIPNNINVFTCLFYPTTVVLTLFGLKTSLCAEKLLRQRTFVNMDYIYLHLPYSRLK